MPRLSRATVCLAVVTAALVTLAAVPADPVGVDLQAHAPHRLFAIGSLLLAVASAVALGIAIGRDMSADAGLSAAVEAAPPTPEPVMTEPQTEAMTRAETEFLANMSHEMRTPLNAVIGFAKLLLSECRGPLGDPQYADYLSHICAGGQHLLAIIDDTLDLCQLAAGKLVLQPRRVEPRAIVEECARSVVAQAQAARIELVVRASTAPAVAADPARLKQVLTNLLSNASKFTGQGGRVSIGATGHDDTVAFEVADTGIGMTPGEIEVAMQPFRMVDGSMTRRHGGIGLGLTLAERLVRLHGGELRIDNHPGRGTMVAAILPASAPRPIDER